SAAAVALVAHAESPDPIRIDGSEANQLWSVGSYPRARSCLWSTRGGPYTAKTSLDLSAPWLSLEDVVGLEQLLDAGVRVRILVADATEADKSRDEARATALRGLARRGAEVYRTGSEAARATFAISDRRHVYVPGAFFGDGPSHALAAGVSHPE